MEHEDVRVDGYSLYAIVSQSLYLLEIDPLTGPEAGGWTMEKFSIYVLAGIHHKGGDYQLVRLDDALIEQIRAALDTIKRGEAVEAVEKSKPRQQS